MIEIIAHGQSKGEASAKITIAEMLLNGELTKLEDTAIQIARIMGVQIRNCEPQERSE